MASNVLSLVYNNKKLYSDYELTLKNGKLYEATLLYNRLREYNLPEVNLRQSTIHGRIGNVKEELDFLLRVLSNKNYVDYNVKMVVQRVVAILKFYFNMDRKEYYNQFLKELSPISKLFGDVIEGDEELKPALHFVEDDGQNRFSTAISKVSNGDPKSAIEELLAVEKTDKMYTQSQNFASMLLITMNEVEEGDKILKNLREEKFANAETYKLLAEFEKTPKAKLKTYIQELDELEKTSIKNEDVKMAKVKIYLKQKDYFNALEVLKTIESNTKYERGFLTLVAECYFNLFDMDMVYKTLKVLCTMHPEALNTRYELLKQNQGKAFSIRNALSDWFNKETLTEAIEYAKNEVRTKDFFNKASVEEASFVFNIIQETRDFDLIKDVAKLILHSKYDFLVQDVLISCKAKPECQQLLFQAVVEEVITKKMSFLRFGKLETFYLEYPSLFREKKGEAEEKVEFLLTAYSQCYSLVYYIDKDVSKFDISGLINKLYETDLSEYPLLLKSDNLVYLLASYVCPENPLIESSFRYIKPEKKEEIKKFLK